MGKHKKKAGKPLTRIELPAGRYERAWVIMEWAMKLPRQFYPRDLMAVFGVSRGQASEIMRQWKATFGPGKYVMFPAKRPKCLDKPKPELAVPPSPPAPAPVRFNLSDLLAPKRIDP